MFEDVEENVPQIIGLTDHTLSEPLPERWRKIGENLREPIMQLNVVAFGMTEEGTYDKKYMRPRSRWDDD